MISVHGQFLLKLAKVTSNTWSAIDRKFWFMLEGGGSEHFTGRYTGGK